MLKAKTYHNIIFIFVDNEKEICNSQFGFNVYSIVFNAITVLAFF